MITRLRLTNFKNFQDAELTLGPLTLLVGTNASGKSNLRDAFRFLHGIAQGYSLAEIIGGKYEGGEMQWLGIRGGTLGIAYLRNTTFALEVTVSIESEDGSSMPQQEFRYSVKVEPGTNGNTPQVVKEALYTGNEMLFDSHPNGIAVPLNSRKIAVAFYDSDKRLEYNNTQPVLSQFAETFPKRGLHKLKTSNFWAVIEAFSSFRFLDLHPEAMRQPPIPGNVLGDHGENLASALQTICNDERSKKTLLSWLQELTPMDAVDFEFPTDPIGRVYLILVERNGQRTSAYSASDGTLRFLTMIAALLGPEPARMYFFEELDTGIHPTRLHLLIQLIEQAVAEGKIQVVATTHSPSLLRLLSPRSLENASVIYRSPDSPAAQIVPILDLPNARRLVQEQDVAELFESGWLEDAIAFQDAAEANA